MLLPRSINVELVANTWPSSILPPAFSGVGPTETVDVAAVLNLIGVLTTPPLSGGASLSELWAFVRYLFAVTPGPELRLTREFLDMDPHQKTILSDDFGMGFTMHWLAQRLDLVAACDGRYFIENHLHRVGGSYSGGTAKNGLGKSPDFIAVDSAGRFHVIECKGTQSSLQYRNSQLRNSGMAQKRTVVFPAALAGERICAGIFIAGPDGDESSMRIVDPEPRFKYRIKEDQRAESSSAVTQGLLAKQLRAAGFPGAAAAVAFPWQRKGIDELAVRAESYGEWNERLARGSEDLNRLRGRNFSARGSEYVGRRTVIDLPRAIEVQNKVYDRIEIRQGLTQRTFDEVREIVRHRRVIDETDGDEVRGKYMAGHSRGRAWMMIGDSFYCDMRFRSS